MDVLINPNILIHYVTANAAQYSLQGIFEDVYIESHHFISVQEKLRIELTLECDGLEHRDLG